MRIYLKNLYKKYKNKILSFLVAVVALPFLTVNSFAFTIPLNSVVVKPDAGNEMEFQFVTENGTVYIDAVYDSGEYSTEFHTTNLDTNVSVMTYKLNSSEFTYSYNYEAYDYYYAINFFFNNENSYFNCDDIRVATYNENDVYIYSQLTNMSYDNTSMRVNDIYYKVFSAIGKLSSSYGQHSVQRIYVRGDGYVGNAQYNECTCYLYQVPKNTSAEEVNSLISAINNQTTTLGGKIDDTNDFINNGNSSTSGIVSGNNSAVDNLNEVVSEYHATEQQFFDDFTSNQQAINSDIVGWSWGGLVNCANWVGNTMTDYYNNMGDFRQYIIYPLMLGIALFFLGRGGSIIGHLFRKPTQSTVNIESTSFKRGNTRYTTSTTSKKGGVFRK